MVTADEMRALEQAAFARGISAEALMDQAGERAAQAVMDFFPTPGVCLAVFGKGNNGGDALVAARHLASAGWETRLVPAFPENEWNALVQKKLGECGLAQHAEVGGLAEAWRRRTRRSGPAVVLDGLLGVGARGELRAAVAAAAKAINTLREQTHAHVFALDLPTGLESDTGKACEGAVRADFTLTIGEAKRGLVADGASTYVGRLIVVPLDELAPAQAGEEVLAIPATLRPHLPRRPFEMHKGDCGRVSIVAGSRGFTGAALLCSEACVRAGAGLVRLHVPKDAYEIVAAAAAPEIMVKAYDSCTEALEDRYDVLAVGPGLGQQRPEEVLTLLREARAPTVIDADGLNILARELSLLSKSTVPRLLAPHPGEMQRLDARSSSLPRAEAVRRFIAEHPVTLLLKGARTVIGSPGEPLSYNTTGNPGMASGGMGDVLTGVCAALAGQKLPLYHSARVGAWVCGRAAELAVLSGRESEESLTARGVIAGLGEAFTALRAGWV